MCGVAEFISLYSGWSLFVIFYDCPTPLALALQCTCIKNNVKIDLVMKWKMNAKLFFLHRLQESIRKGRGAVKICNCCSNEEIQTKILTSTNVTL